MSDLDKFKARMDAKANELMKNHPGYVPLKGGVNSGEIKPLPTVPVTPLPKQPYYWPFKTEEEYIEAVKRDSEMRVEVLDNEKIRRGEVSIWYRLKNIGVISLILTVLAGGFWAYLKGCG